ncbi:O-fucosyltransferase 23-like isoform X2 [Dioscorea cayenensis subsp. rotundata]|nr:O-fucosyltransferase 23-like isoform X2 [Dioscorea cayenensis subsp. rotundata]XP_039115356.1 O-fucosyltransferase 23-like isoform X2 [Dioscorea cayenensis subsp. rotundata]
MNSVVWKLVLLALILFALKTVILHPFPGFWWIQQKGIHWTAASTTPAFQSSVRKDKFLEVPQIAWGLNNQKIAFARACLTARLLNRTLLMPSLSASLFYKEVELLEAVAFDKIFQFERFNTMCNGFIRLGRYSDLLNQAKPFELQKGSGRKWTKEKDLHQLEQCKEDSVDKFELIQIVGKNPFLWHDHWPVTDYAKIFECMSFVEEIEEEAVKVISKIREVGAKARSESFAHDHTSGSLIQSVPYIAVHMRVEKDWMIHCKKLEQRLNINQICSNKTEITERVAKISVLQKPIVVYLAVADSLLEDNSILSGWHQGLLPFEKKKLGVWDIYKKYPYLVQSAIDYEVCLRADVFIGNSYSTFSSLIVLERTLKLIKIGVARSCGRDARLPSYAYNIVGKDGGPQSWMTDFSASNLQSISYGTNNVSCESKVLQSKWK